MNAQKKPAHVPDPATRESRQSASLQTKRDPREDDNAPTKSASLTEPIQREPIPAASAEDETRPPIIREPDEPEETKTPSVMPPIDRPDDDEEA